MEEVHEVVDVVEEEDFEVEVVDEEVDEEVEEATLMDLLIK